MQPTVEDSSPRGLWCDALGPGAHYVEGAQPTWLFSFRRACAAFSRLCSARSVGSLRLPAHEAASLDVLGLHGLLSRLSARSALRVGARSARPVSGRAQTRRPAVLMRSGWNRGACAWQTLCAARPCTTILQDWAGGATQEERLRDPPEGHRQRFQTTEESACLSASRPRGEDAGKRTWGDRSPGCTRYVELAWRPLGGLRG